MATAVALPTLFDQPPTWGPLPSTPAPKTPYATLKSEVARPREYVTGGQAYDYRKVTITVYGSYNDVTAALQNVLAIFNANTTLTFPSGAPFLRWKPLDSGMVKPDEHEKQGQQLWMGDVTAEVWSQRAT